MHVLIIKVFHILWNEKFVCPIHTRKSKRRYPDCQEVSLNFLSPPTALSSYLRFVLRTYFLSLGFTDKIFRTPRRTLSQLEKQNF
jgi:hypothetical protein